jgi:hypothetical protein
MIRILAVIVLGLGGSLLAQAPTPTVIQLPTRSTPPSRALKYTLLPEGADLTPGNAASLWRQAVSAAREVKLPMTEKENKWLGPGPEGTALKDLPRKEIREHLDKAKGILRFADLAARRLFVDWDYQPLTIQSIAEGLPLGEIQGFREIAALLSLRFRLQLSEGKIDEALYTLQTGFALGRHISEGPILIQNLVGVAITAIMFGKLEELMAQPDAPNMYWALTALPRPLIDARRPVEYELGTFHRSFPQLRDADKPSLTKEQADSLAAEVFNVMAKMCYPDAPEWQGKLAASLTVPTLLPQAKKDLIARGRKKETVEEMPASQVVLIWFAEEYNRERDEILKCYLLPAEQALPMLEEIDKKDKEARKKAEGTLVIQGTWMLRQLTPAILKVYEANLRTERMVATLRTVEAIRLYAAAHDGKLPDAVKDITEVPLPSDPRTGKSFDEFYKRDGDKATFEVPLHPGILIRRYELATPK